MVAQNNRGRVLLKLGLVLLVLAVIGVAVAYRLQGTARVKLVQRGTAVDAVTGTVSVDADGGTRELKSEAAGKVVWCEALDAGRKFKEGDKLLELDATELKRQIEETTRRFLQDKERAQITLTGNQPELLANANSLPEAEREKLLRSINPNRRLAQERLETAKRLRALGNVSDEEVKTLERALEGIDLELRLKLLEEKQREADYRATMTAMQEQLGRMTITAPADGQVEGAFAWKGMLINNGQTVAVWFAPERVVTAKISEESFGRVKLGQKARLRLLTYGRQEFDATVSKLLPKADDAQRFTVFLDVKVDPEQLKPGSTGEVTITVDERPDQLMIPRRALFDGDKVLVVKNGRVERRVVKVGYVALNVVEILSGLEVGEQVIVDTLEDFREGERVRVEVVS